ncbi:hypothetical protein L9G74_08695 [Shewanella sp. C32]|uniref:Uncharacterized protein n=1 Tax=Shewanella electrica TaxID=515560 RepID=A0ABT2FJJ8_9GAMM|nr:hypothetical protein [Shewanella electrica]MCH1924613.1 hypothetical protein [Shewanella electrica]MCS4556514.1 hypothetical protein [Shewanella electrica]
MKKILLVMPKFFDYEMRFAESLSKMGDVVSVVYDENKFFLPRIHIRVFLLIIRFILSCVDCYWLWKKYYRLASVFSLRYASSSGFEKYILEHIPVKQVDLVVVVKGFGFSSGLVQEIKEKCKPERMVLYQWDIIDRFPQVIEIYSLFDRVFTFERNDLEKWRGSLYLPTPVDMTRIISISKELINKESPKIDFCYVGSFTFYRFFKLKALKRNLKKSHCKFTFILVTKSKLLSRIFPDVSNEVITETERVKLYLNSKYVVELGHPGQTGLTQRCLESFVCQRPVYYVGDYNKLSLDAHFSKFIFGRGQVAFSMEINDGSISEVFKGENNRFLDCYSYDYWADRVTNS